MAGQFRFKNSSGAIVAQISASNAGAMSFSGSAVDFSSVTSLTLGTSTLTGTASFATAAVSSSYSNIALTGSNAMTASSADTLYVRNNATVLGSITAQTLVVQTVTSSVDYVTGSTRFGSLQANTHIFTGSLSLTGSAVFLGGNVGLGTTSAGKLLHLYATNDNASVRFTNTAASKVWDLTPANPNVANSGFSIYNVTDNTTPFHVTDAGNIGIGNSGNSSRRLEVSQPSGYSAGIRIIADSGGDAKIQFLASGGSSQPDIGPAASAPNDLIFGVGGSERMRITSGGNVVINTSGTSAPNAGQLVNRQRSDSSTPYLNGIVNMASGSSTTLSIWYDGSVHIIGASYYTGGDGGAYKPLTFQTGDVERMRITNTGRFGFNTTSPSRHYVFSNPDSRGAGGFEINATDSLVTFLSYNRSTSTYLPLSLSEGSSNVLINSTNDVGAKLYVNGSTRMDGALSILQSSNSNATYIEGNYNTQGSATNYKIVRHYPVVSSGSKLIIPFTSQGNLNGSTIVKIMGHAAMWNTRNPRAFTAEFAVGHLTVLSDLAVLSSTGNISSISISGMNIEISFTSAYTSATANGIYATIEYMTYVPSYSIIIGSIAMN